MLTPTPTVTIIRSQTFMVDGIDHLATVTTVCNAGPMISVFQTYQLHNNRTTLVQASTWNNERAIAIFNGWLMEMEANPNVLLVRGGCST